MRRGIIRFAGAAISIGISVALLGAAASAWAACPECDEYKLVIPPVQSAGDGNSGPPSSQGEDTGVSEPVAPASAPPAVPPPVEQPAPEPAAAASGTTEKADKRKRPTPKPTVTTVGSSQPLPASRPLEFDTAGALGAGGALLILAAIAAPFAAAALRRRRTGPTATR